MLMKFDFCPLGTDSLPRLSGWVSLCLWMVLGCNSFPCVAGALFKCSSSDGSIAYTSKVANFHNCLKIGNYADAPAAAPTKSAASTTAGVQYQSAAPPAPDSAAVAASVTDTSSLMPASAKPEIESHVQRGAVYKISRANGITEYTNIKPGKSAGVQLLFTYIANCYACDVHSSIDWDNTPLKPNAYRDEIAQAATQFGVDQALLRAVIHAESAFNPNAVSTKGAQGLMQLMPGTASDLEVSNPFDAGQNIRGGAHYLASLLKDFHGDERLATAAYNAGPGNVQKYGGIPPFDETKVYVDRVALLRERYRFVQ